MEELKELNYEPSEWNIINQSNFLYYYVSAFTSAFSETRVQLSVHVKSLQQLGYPDQSKFCCASEFDDWQYREVKCPKRIVQLTVTDAVSHVERTCFNTYLVAIGVEKQPDISHFTSKPYLVQLLIESLINPSAGQLTANTARSCL